MIKLTGIAAAIILISFTPIVETEEELELQVSLHCHTIILLNITKLNVYICHKTTIDWIEKASLGRGFLSLVTTWCKDMLSLLDSLGNWLKGKYITIIKHC